jgi:hypothetical protein
MFGKRTPPADKTKKRRLFTVPGKLAANRKANLVQKLLGRHIKRIDNNEDGNRSDEGSSRSEKSVVSGGRKKTPMKNIVTWSIRKKRAKAAEKVASSPHPISPRQTLLQSLSPMTEPAFSPNNHDSHKQFFSARHPEEYDEKYNEVIDSALSNNLLSDFDAEDPQRRYTPEAKPRPWVVGGAIASAGICAVSILFLGFAALPTLAGLVTIALTFHLINQDTVLSTTKKVRQHNRKVQSERETWYRANSHLRARLMAANTSLLRAPVIKASLEELIRNNTQRSRNYQLNASQAVVMNRKLVANFAEIENRQRSQVLLIISKAIMISNSSRANQRVLNSLGVEVIISRLSKLDGVEFDPEDFHQLLEQYGHSQEAIGTLYQLLLDKQSPLIKYDMPELTK